MKAEAIEVSMLAACGINCTACYMHLGKKPCAGCRAESSKRNNYCGRCKIRNCSVEKGLSYCFECEQFPCKLIKSIDKRYRVGYGISLIENSLAAKEKGIEAFLSENLKRYTCTSCGGIISMHDGDCSECGTEYILGKRSVKR